MVRNFKISSAMLNARRTMNAGREVLVNAVMVLTRVLTAKGEHTAGRQ